MSENQEEREKIKRIHDVMTSNDSIDHWGVGALEREFVDCLFRMADAPFTELMLRVNTKFYLDTGVHILTSEERIRSHKLGRAKIIEAILARDEELTLLYAKRSNRLGADWLAEEIAAQRRGEPSAKLL